MGCLYSKAAQGEVTEKAPINPGSIGLDVDSNTSLQEISDPIKSTRHIRGK